VNDDAKEKDLQIHSLSGKICEVLIRERIQIERLFFDFDETEDGTLTLSELTRLIYFLRINANKGSIKLLFEAIDYEKKNYFTLNEFKHFLSESSFIRQTEK
jgi:Ca2+-binding EF-hand superfamily protein